MFRPGGLSARARAHRPQIEFAWRIGLALIWHYGVLAESRTA
jgi:hypothetical protein